MNLAQRNKTRRLRIRVSSTRDNPILIWYFFLMSETARCIICVCGFNGKNVEQYHMVVVLRRSNFTQYQSMKYALPRTSGIGTNLFTQENLSWILVHGHLESEQHMMYSVIRTEKKKKKKNRSLQILSFASKFKFVFIYIKYIIVVCDLETNGVAKIFTNSCLCVYYVERQFWTPLE